MPWASKACDLVADPSEDFVKKVDEVIGAYEEGPKGRAGRLKNLFLTWVVGALLAVMAVATIVLIIESHRLPKEMPKKEAKPVPVQIVPAPEPRPR